VLEIARAYRRILDGRAVVASLRLGLECRPEDAQDLPQDAPPGARFARLFLVARSSLQEAVSLETGPATLFVTRSVVGRTGIERDAVETRTFDNLRRFEVGPGAPAEASLARFFVSAAEGEIASRMRFELELRSGSAWILTKEEAAARATDGAKSGGSKAGAAPSGREVPVMRMRVADAEQTAYEPALVGRFRDWVWRQVEPILERSQAHGSVVAAATVIGGETQAGSIRRELCDERIVPVGRALERLLKCVRGKRESGLGGQS
jgi:hypothetical protein